MARPKLHTSDLGDALLDAAVDAVAAGGATALSVREVARTAGTSTTAVYSLFGSRAALLRAVLIRAFDSFSAAQRAAATADPDPGGLVALGTAYIGWALENPRLYELMFGDTLAGIEHTAESREAAARAIAPLRAGIVAGIDAGLLRDAPVDTVVASLWAQVHGMSMLLLSGNYPDGADPVAAATAVVDGWRP